MKVFITGITGTLGTAIAQYHSPRSYEVVGCGRSETRLAEWMRLYDSIGTAYLGDCLNLWDNTTDIYKQLVSSDIVYHCAALKHVDLCERQPVEAYRQNVGTVDLISELCSSLEIPLVFVSTDKACMPSGVYGATKLIGEKIVLNRGGAVVRFGNLIGSSGSVFQKWSDDTKRGKPITLTDPKMTRFFISVEEAAKFTVDNSVKESIRIPVMKAIQLGELANELGAKVQVIGRRPGETQHQWLVAPGEPASVDYHSGVIRLGEGPTTNQCLSSETARRWDLKELLDIAIPGV